MSDYDPSELPSPNWQGFMRIFRERGDELRDIAEAAERHIDGLELMCEQMAHVCNEHGWPRELLIDLMNSALSKLPCSIREEQAVAISTGEIDNAILSFRGVLIGGDIENAKKIAEDAAALWLAEYSE